MATQTQILNKQENVRQKLDFLYLSLLDKYIDEFRKTHPELPVGDDEIDLYNLTTVGYHELLNDPNLSREERNGVRADIQSFIMIYQKLGVKLPEYVSNDFLKTRMYALNHKANTVLQKRLEERQKDDEQYNKNEDTYQKESSKARNAIRDKKAIKQELKKIKGIEKSENRKLKRQIGRKGIRELKKLKDKNLDKYAKEHLKMTDEQLEEYKYLLEENDNLKHPRADLIKANKNRALGNLSVRARSILKGLGAGVATLGRGVKYAGIGVLKGLKHLALLPVHIYRSIAKKSEENMNKGFEKLVQDAVDSSTPGTPTQEVQPQPQIQTEQTHEVDPRKEFAEGLKPEQEPVVDVKPKKPDIPNVLGLSEQQLNTEQGKILNELIHRYDTATNQENKNILKAALETNLISLMGNTIPEQSKALLAQSILHNEDSSVRNKYIIDIYNKYEARTSEGR